MPGAPEGRRGAGPAGGPLGAPGGAYPTMVTVAEPSTVAQPGSSMRK